MHVLSLLDHLNVPDALHAGRIDVGVVGRGDATSGLSKAAAATAHHPLESEAIVSDAGVRGEADDGESLRGRDLRRENGGRAAAKLAEALGGVQRGRILIIRLKHFEVVEDA